MFRLLSSIVVVVVAFAACATPAGAGGWALATVAYLPAEITVERGTYIDVQLLQHGVTPFAGGSPSLTAVNMESGTEYTAESRESEVGTGVYRFQVALPEAGGWKWWVTNDPFPGVTTFSPLHVSAGESNATPTAGTSDDVIVVMRDSMFQPSRLEIAAGTTVTWRNADTVPHQVSSGQTLWFVDSPMLATGETYSFVFDDVGTFDYLCGPHPGMTGQIVVR